MREDATYAVKTATSWMAKTAILLGFTVAIQMFGLPQPVTGPAVNAMLLLTAMTVDPWSGVLVGVSTPVIALYRGILLAPLAPMIPFIALGNAAFVLLYSLVRKRHKIVALAVASIAKFIILSMAVRFLVTVPEPVAYAMQAPQLLTALAGGAIALIVHAVVSKHLGHQKT